MKGSNLENINFHNYHVGIKHMLMRMNPAKYGFEENTRGKPRIAFKFTPKNVELLEKYYIDIVNEGITKPRILSVLDQTCRLLQRLNKDWDLATIDEVKQVVNYVRSTDFTEHTKSDYLSKLKRFDRWFNNNEYSEKTRWVKTTIKSRCYKLPNQLINPEEAQLLIGAARCSRDRA